MSRERTSLDGPWEFQYDPGDKLFPEMLAPDRVAVVPMPWQAQFADLRHRGGTAWYRRRLHLGPLARERQLLLGFGAVDYEAGVWLNSAFAGSHEGGFLPFELDVTQLARPGENVLTVRVSDPGALFAEIPHGKQSWYGPLSGIWQPVWLEQRNRFHLHSPRLLPNLTSGEVALSLSFSQPAPAGCQMTVALIGPDGQTVAKRQVDVAEGAPGFEGRLAVEQPLSWSPDAPHLYQAQLTLSAAGEPLDALVEPFGFRSIETRDGRLHLNGELLLLRGALDQDYYPGTISTPRSLAFLEDQVRKAKALGLNCLRCHIKAPDPRYYEVADRLGMLIWSELPSWRSLSGNAGQRVRATMEGILGRDGNHPSIIIWTLVNEDWGTELSHDPAHRSWLKETYRWLKELDPDRLVVDNSPCEGNFHVQSDLEDYHFYRAIPDRSADWDRFVNEFAARLAPTYSPYGDAVRTGSEPLILSEFGNWGLPDVNLLRDGDGQLPWWFETGLDWGGGAVYPQGVQQRFHRWGLDRVFGSWQAFVEATQWQQFAALKYEIESMRRQPAISGYVITEFTDVQWESNGLLDMERNPKVFHDAFASVNRATVLLSDAGTGAGWVGKPLTVGVAVAHGAEPALPPGKVSWRLEPGLAEGSLSVPGLAPGSVTLLDTIRLLAPEVEKALSVPLVLSLEDQDGKPLATHRTPLTFFPQHAVSSTARIWTAQPSLAGRLQALGYQLVADPRAADLLVTDQLTYPHAELVRQGARLLLLVQDEAAIGGDFLGLQVRSRRGTLWSGDWASSFAWLRREGPFARFPGGPLLDSSFLPVMPHYVLTGPRDGLGPWDFEQDVFAGIFVGWVHKVAALLLQRQYGAGRVVASTFRINPLLLGVDPVTTHLLDALVTLSLEDRTS